MMRNLVSQAKRYAPGATSPVGLCSTAYVPNIRCSLFQLTRVGEQSKEQVFGSSSAYRIGSLPHLAIHSYYYLPDYTLAPVSARPPSLPRSAVADY